MTEQIEQWLIDQEVDKEKVAKAKIYAVADLQLAFDNTPLMKLLEQRAFALKAGKFEKARKI